MRVAVRRHPRLAAEQLVDRHVGALALDVPQRLIDAAHRVVEHRAVAPIRADVHRLPDVFDVVRVFAFEERRQELVDRRDDRLGALVEGRAAKAVEPRLAGIDFDDRQPDARCGDEHRLHVGDLQRRKPVLRLPLLRARLVGEGLMRCQPG